jgi:hypothetical protein
MAAGDEAKTGSLVVVGTGIQIAGQLTPEALAWIKRADRLLYAVGDPVAAEAVRQLNPGAAESLAPLYADDKPRMATYNEMIDRILDCVGSGMLTCVAAYGHPGVSAYPFHQAIRQARALGYPARMLPAVSAADCLFADLGIDPTTHGCQSFEATDFLLHGRLVDPSAALILWQIGLVGDLLFHHDGFNPALLPLLVERLGRFYPADHVCTLYEAAAYPGLEPTIRLGRLSALAELPVTWESTLYIPPSRLPQADLDILSRIGALMVARAGARA